MAERKIGGLVENHRIWGSSELKPSKLLAFCESISLIHCRNAAGNFTHSDLNQSNFSNIRPLRVDDVNLSYWERGQQWLSPNIVIFSWIAEIRHRVRKQICSWQFIAFEEFTSNGCVPSVVAPRTEEGLIDSTINKWILYNRFYFGSHLLNSKHVEERIVIVFKPEAISSLYISYRLSGAF